MISRPAIPTALYFGYPSVVPKVVSKPRFLRSNVAVSASVVFAPQRRHNTARGSTPQPRQQHPVYVDLATLCIKQPGDGDANAVGVDRARRSCEGGERSSSCRKGKDKGGGHYVGCTEDGPAPDLFIVIAKGRWIWRLQSSRRGCF